MHLEETVQVNNSKSGCIPSKKNRSKCIPSNSLMIADAEKAISGGSKILTYFFHSEFTSGGGEERAYFAGVQNSHYQANRINPVYCVRSFSSQSKQVSVFNQNTNHV